jgi:hypothetical protein
MAGVRAVASCRVPAGRRLQISRLVFAATVVVQYTGLPASMNIGIVLADEPHPGRQNREMPSRIGRSVDSLDGANRGPLRRRPARRDERRGHRRTLRNRDGPSRGDVPPRPGKAQRPGLRAGRGIVRRFRCGGRSGGRQEVPRGLRGVARRLPRHRARSAGLSREGLVAPMARRDCLCRRSGRCLTRQGDCGTDDYQPQHASSHGSSSFD